MDKIEEIYEEINSHVRQALNELEWAKNYSLIVYGSAANGLASSKNSDLDLSLIIHDYFDPSRASFGGQTFLGIKQIRDVLETIKYYLED